MTKLFSRLATISVILVPLLAGACSTPKDDGYPSLAKRPIEGISTRPPEAQPEPPAPPADAALLGEIDTLRGQALSGESAFRNALGAAQARTRAAGGSAVSSEPWLNAQMAISGADAARAASVTALASLDKLKTERTNAGNLAGRNELTEAIEAVGAIVAAQDAALRGLSGSLRQP